MRPGAAAAVVRVLVLVGTAAFFLACIARGELSMPAAPARPRDVALSTVLLAGVFAWGVLTWRYVLTRVGDDVGPDELSFGALLRVWALSSPARWLPGGVWQFVAVGVLAPAASARAGARGRLLGALVAHTAFSLAAAALVAAATLPAASGAWTAGAAVVGGAFVHPGFLRRAFAVAGRVAHAPRLAWRGDWRDGAALLALHVASWLAYGVAFSLLLRGLVETPSVPLGTLTGAAALSFLVGYAAVVAPAGIGPREVALSLLLAPTLGGAAPGVALLARVWSMAAEFALTTAVLGASACSKAARARRRVADAR